MWTSTKLTVENFVHKDGEITVHGALTDPELLTLKDKGEEAIEEKPLAPFTLSQTWLSINTLRSYALRTETSDNFFPALIIIENELDNVRWKSLHKKEIADYFIK